MSAREEGAPASQIESRARAARAAAYLTRVPRFDHGSRVPGWDEAVDLEKDPALIPDPEQVEVPEGLRVEIEARMARLPGSALRRAAGAEGRPARSTAGARRRPSSRWPA